jgi:hypothetical protein
VEIEVAIPVGCLVPVAMLRAVTIAVGVLLSAQANHSCTNGSVMVRVIDDGAPGGPAALATTFVPSAEAGVGTWRNASGTSAGRLVSTMGGGA